MKILTCFNLIFAVIISIIGALMYANPLNSLINNKYSSLTGINTYIRYQLKPNNFTYKFEEPNLIISKNEKVLVINLKEVFPSVENLDRFVSTIWNKNSNNYLTLKNDCNLFITVNNSVFSNIECEQIVK